KLTSVKFIDSEEYEVIGNVWDNPELLEGTE
ncbi:YopX family protein, partial [Enterococcus faecalis]